jgi:tetratricopeptide (TPR) repeat protein
MSFLHEPGDLARTPLAAILLEALNLRATGVLTVHHGGGTSRLFIQDGKPVGAQVVTGLRPLGHMLLQAGAIDIDTLSRSLALMAETRRPQGEILIEAGAVSRDQVDQALTEQQAGYFNLIAALEQGAYAFDAATPIPAWAGQSHLSPLRTIVDALERPQAGALVISALQPVSSGAVRLTSGYRNVAGAFRWTGEERVLVARLESPITLDAFFAPCDVSPERSRAIMAGLLLLGVAVAAGDARQPTGETAGGLDLADVIPPAPTPPASAGGMTSGTVGSSSDADRGGVNASPTSSSAPGRRSDPAEARARRQRLLQQAMRNMGIGPFSGPGRPTPPPAAAAQAHAPGPAARPASPPDSAEAALRKALLEAAPRARDKDLFARLGLASGAGRDEVKQAFLSMARQFHPDRFASPALADLAEKVKEFFTAVNEAYETLSDEKKRSAYMAQRRDAWSAEAEAARTDFAKGEACLRTRDWVKARGFLEAAVRADAQPDYQAALALAIVSDPASRDRERARSLVEEALHSPACDRAAYVAGLLARDAQDEARAEKMFRAALAANPRNADAVRELRLLDRKRPR